MLNRISRRIANWCLNKANWFETYNAAIDALMTSRAWSCRWKEYAHRAHPLMKSATGKIASLSQENRLLKAELGRALELLEKSPEDLTWHDCASQGCIRKTCRALRSPMCYVHTAEAIYWKLDEPMMVGIVLQKLIDLQHSMHIPKGSGIKPDEINAQLVGFKPLKYSDWVKGMEPREHEVTISGLAVEAYRQWAGKQDGDGDAD